MKSLTVCPCCGLPSLLFAIFATYLAVRVTESIFAVNQDAAGRLKDSVFVKGLRLASRSLGVFLVGTAVFLFLLRNSPSLQQRFFSILCSCLASNPALDARRCALLEGLHGTVVELGPGPGTNFRCLGGEDAGSRITNMILLEPNTFFAPKIAAEKEKYNVRFPVQVVYESAESGAAWQAIRNNSVDFVIGTHVLCSTADNEQVLAHVSRVLKPSTGEYRFLEHVSAQDDASFLGLSQRLMAPVFNTIAAGCSFRRLWDVIPASLPKETFDVQIEHFEAPLPIYLIKPHIYGTAKKRLVDA